MPSNNTTRDEEKEIDIIYAILHGSPFKIKPQSEKLDILKKGRPVYDLNVLNRTTNKNCNRTFHSSWYNVHKWLCGSKSYNKLFCWPCLLMRPETSSWCSIGNDDLKRFTALASKHERCKSHLKAICEYDETLSSFGLSPEFISESNFKCKEEECSLSDKTEADDDVGNSYFQETEQKESITGTDCYIVKPVATESVKEHITPKNNEKISFKMWQEMYKDTFPVSKSRFLEDTQLYKWKRKIAKQELKNAKLVGEKLKFEIEVLKAKIEYYKALKLDEKAGDGPFTSVTTASESLDL